MSLLPRATPAGNRGCGEIRIENSRKPLPRQAVLPADAARLRPPDPEDENERAGAREAALRGRRERLPEAEREAIVAAVKAENPGIGRFKNMLEPLRLAALEKSLDGGAAAQQGLFPDLD
jgi:hypothetical protein